MMYFRYNTFDALDYAKYVLSIYHSVAGDLTIERNHTAILILKRLASF